MGDREEANRLMLRELRIRGRVAQSLLPFVSAHQRGEGTMILQTLVLAALLGVSASPAGPATASPGTVRHVADI